MAITRQSVDIGAPVHVAYDQLVHFENYSSFMQDIDAVRQTDDRHLHWSGKTRDDSAEWEAEITELLPDRCVAWRNVDGPLHAGRFELQPLGHDRARVTMMMECDPAQFAPVQDEDADEALADRLRADLARLRVRIEHELQTGERATAEQDTDIPPAKGGGSSAVRQASRAGQSDYSLSQAADDDTEDGRFTVSEEQNFDQQSDQARRVGQAPRDVGAAGTAQLTEAEKLKPSIERAIPPSA